MTPDEALAAIEREFNCIEWQVPTDDAPGSENYRLASSKAPNGEPYVSICTGGLRLEGQPIAGVFWSADAAAMEWYLQVKEYARLRRWHRAWPHRSTERATLYWRIKPEIDTVPIQFPVFDHESNSNQWLEREGYFVYSRLLIVLNEGKREFGALKGQATIGPEFFDPVYTENQ
jgi:hypothetical protein